MSYITLGNLTRFFDKLKDYLDGKYLKNGGIASSLNVKNLRMRADIGSKDTPKITFTNNINSEIVSLYGLQSSVSGKSLIASIDGSNYSVLHTGNAYSYFPSKTGSGATGTWPINISGNALNDSDGNKIVDTYAKKSDIPAGSNITVDDTLSVISTNPVQNKVIKNALDGKLSTEDNDLNSISYSNGTISQLCSSTNANLTLDARGAKLTQAATLKLTNNGMEFIGVRTGHTNLSFNVNDSGVSLNGTLLLTVPTANTLYARISNGHLVINGSELWVE